MLGTGLGSAGTMDCRIHSGLSMWLGLFTVWWLGSQGSTPRMKVPHFESQTIIFLEAHGILGSGMGFNLCFPTKSVKELGHVFFFFLFFLLCQYLSFSFFICAVNSVAKWNVNFFLPL